MDSARQRTPEDHPLEEHVSKKPRLEEPNNVEESAVKSSLVGTSDATSGAKQPKRRKGKERKKKHQLPEECTAEDVVYRDALNLIGEEAAKRLEDEGKDWTNPFGESKVELELEVVAVSSEGSALSLAPSEYGPWVIVTPHALPGEKIKARVFRNTRFHSYADLLEVITPNDKLRDVSRVKCKYFTKCSGCQYQMLSYETQLDWKKNVVVKAYQNYSNLPGTDIPTVLPTIGSPLQYSYRTKLTPHFDAPTKNQAKNIPDDGSRPEWLRIGFNGTNSRSVMDIEECPIGTKVLNEKYAETREEVARKIGTYKRGVSLLLRESLEIPLEPNEPSDSMAIDSAAEATSPTRESSPTPVPIIPEYDLSHDLEKKLCITDHKGTIRERVGDMLFQYTAGSFFQNNNSILVPLTSYVRKSIFHPPPSISPTSSLSEKPTHLVDAYCGAGLFALTLSPYFKKISGIELSEDSIKSAKRSASLNNVSPQKCEFTSGDAANIFAQVQDFPRQNTAVIIDPPRRGSDEKFLDQLIKFTPGVIVYVSCNVHTQARDVGMFLRKARESLIGEGKEYVLETLRGFDLFPQTAHVESVAVLRLLTNQKAEEFRATASSQ
ncbi:class I-like SAM-binding methyltransferase superfamily protein [Abortiporus biennis]